ncbi:MAG TPA: LysM peptidoglycan-binding domain-containing protein [Bacteroidales bacterium]|nr:LysM peptidoglycan-binding domain-containing protein [Bacteroidales bacterium]
MEKLKDELKITSLFVSVFVFLLVNGITVSAQVVVEKSKEKVIISGNQYYIHIVKKGETAFSIAKAYGITVDELVKNNPSAATVLKEGQALRIPVVETISDEQKKTEVKEQQRDESKFFYHKIRPGDTVYSLAKSYGVSVDEIVQSNPGVDINKLPVNAEIAIPRRSLTTTTKDFEVSEKEYLYHRIMKGESLASIAEKYGITIRELRRENRGIIFPRVNDSLRIPVQRVVDFKIKADTVAADTIKTVPDEDFEIPSEIIPVRNLKGEFNVGVLLPLYTRESSIRAEIDSSQVIKGKRIYKTIYKPEHWLYPSSIQFLELYNGILVAADTLRNMGLDINIYAFDTSTEEYSVDNLIKTDRLKKMDMIIGPVFTDELIKVADYLRDSDIPVISPVPLRSNIPLKNNPEVFMTIPSIKVVQNLIVRRASQFKNSNFVFIHNDRTWSDSDVINFRNMLLREITSNNEYNNVKFKELLYMSRSELPADSINRLEQALSQKDENVVIIASEENPVLSETIMELSALTKKYNIRLIGYPAVRELFNLDPKLYFDLGIELYSHYWIDYRQPDVKAFLKTYRNKFLTEPEEVSFAWQGYDIMYYFLSGLAIHGKRFLRRPSVHNPDLLETKFYFRRESRDDGFENSHLYLLKYTSSMDIIILAEESEIR